MNYRKIIKNISNINYFKVSIRYILEYSEHVFYLNKLKEYHLKNKKYNFEKIQNKKLLRMMKFSKEHSIYYKRIFEENNVDLDDPDKIKKELKKIPLLTKEVINSNKEEIANYNLKSDFMEYLTTGGSTGEPLGFYNFGSFDKQHQKFLYKLHGYKSGDRILTLDGTLVDKECLKKNIFWVKKSKKDLPYGSMSLSSHYLNDDSMRYYIEFICSFKPTFIRGYPSFITKIAKEIKSQDIKIDWKLKGVQFTSESFTEKEVEISKNAFNVSVFSQYGHTEASVFGYSVDDKLEIHCSPLYGYTEVLNELGEPVEENQIGELIVTGFNYYGQSFIRYKTGDLGSYKKNINGITILNNIIGRTQDIIYDDNGNEVRLTALIFGRHYKAMGNIKKWQIVQEKKGEVSFHIIKNDSYSSKDEEEIRNNFFDIGRIKTSFKYVNEIPLTIRGKSKLLVQNIRDEGHL